MLTRSGQSLLYFFFLAIIFGSTIEYHNLTLFRIFAVIAFLLIFCIIRLIFMIFMFVMQVIAIGLIM